MEELEIDEKYALGILLKRIVDKADEKRRIHERGLHKSNPRFEIDYWIRDVLDDVFQKIDI